MSLEVVSRLKRCCFANHRLGQDDVRHGWHDAHFYGTGDLFELFGAFAAAMATAGRDNGGFAAPFMVKMVDGVL